MSECPRRKVHNMKNPLAPEKKSPKVVADPSHQVPVVGVNTPQVGEGSHLIKSVENGDCKFKKTKGFSFGGQTAFVHH